MNFGSVSPKMLNQKGFILSKIHLDFGAGNNPRNPFQSEKLITVDILNYEHNFEKVLIKPGEKIPIEDASIDSISAYDVLEHLDRNGNNNLFIFYMNELHRILKTNGIAVFIFPYWPKKDAFSDPTHVNFITSRTIDYFENAQIPYYEGISTQYKILCNHKLRIFKYWIDEAETTNRKYKTSFRRKISLCKRNFKRFINPNHRIWVLVKK